GVGELALVAHALYAAGGGAGAIEGGHQDCNRQCDDADDEEEFDEGEWSIAGRSDCSWEQCRSAAKDRRCGQNMHGRTNGNAGRMGSGSWLCSETGVESAVAAAVALGASGIAAGLNKPPRAVTSALSHWPE